MADADITFGPLAPSDLPGVGRLFEAHTGRPADLDTFERWIEGFPSARAHCSGVLVGFLACCRFAPDVLEMATVVVAPEHRRHGVAARLAETIEHEAASRGFAAMIVGASSLNQTVGPRADHDRLYARLGYEALYSTADTLIAIKTLGAAEPGAQIPRSR